MRLTIRSSAVTLLAALLLVVAVDSASSASASTARKLLGTAAAGFAGPIVSFGQPKPLTGVELAIDQALGTTAAPTPAPVTEPAVTRVVTGPTTGSSTTGQPADAGVAPAVNWACGVSDAVCDAAGTLAAVGGTASFQIAVAADEGLDMIVFVNFTSGHADL